MTSIYETGHNATLGTVDHILHILCTPRYLAIGPSRLCDV